MSSGTDMTVANVGDVLAGKYRVDRVLGIGGMGMVVAATHVEIDQKVAIKFMLADATATGAMTERFLREARAVVKLRGENVCRVFDTGKLPTGAPFIVMELMDGEDLGRTIAADAPMPLARAVHYLLQALEGIAEAHANGIVHRDLKPGNLFVTSSSDGAPLVKVLDFGISKTPIGGMPAHTRTGDVMGSPGYMAPEQMVSSKDVDARADIWSLGVILYQMITAHVPWESESLPALCMSVMSDPPPPLPDGVPAPLRAAVMRCLEKERTARFADVGELAAAIAPYGPRGAEADARRIANVLGRRSSVPARSAETTAPARAVPPLIQSTAVHGGRRWKVIGGLAVLGLLVGAIVAVSSDKEPPVQPPVPLAPPIPKAAPVTAAEPVPVPAPAPVAAAAPVPAPAPAPVAAAAPVPVPVPAHPAIHARPTTAKPTIVTVTPTPTPTLTPTPVPSPSPSPSPLTSTPTSPSTSSPGESDPWTHMQHDKP